MNKCCPVKIKEQKKKYEKDNSDTTRKISTNYRHHILMTMKMPTFMLKLYKV